MDDPYQNLINLFIKLYTQQNNEDLCSFDTGEIFKIINIATLKKLDRTINNKDFKFKYKQNEKYAVFLSKKSNFLYGKPKSILKICEKNLKLNIQKTQGNSKSFTEDSNKRNFAEDEKKNKKNSQNKNYFCENIIIENLNLQNSNDIEIEPGNIPTDNSGNFKIPSIGQKSKLYKDYTSFNSYLNDFDSLKNEEKNYFNKIYSDKKINTKNNDLNNLNPLIPAEILNFDYTKFNYYLSFIKIEDFSELKNISQKNLNLINLLNLFSPENIFILDFLEKIKIKNRIILNRDFAFLNHTNIESCKYFRSKNIINSNFIFSDFEEEISNHKIIDIEVRKYDMEQKVIEDGVLYVVFLICEDLGNLVDLFSKIKYEVYYSKSALVNYISKYTYDLIYEYTNISDSFLNFLKNFGFVNQENNNLNNVGNSVEETRENLNVSFINREKENNLKVNKDKVEEKKEGCFDVVFPLKNKIKNLVKIIGINLINYLKKNISSVSKYSNSLNSIPYSKFLKLFVKYNSHQINEEGLLIKHCFLSKFEHEEFRYLKDFVIVDKIHDKMSKNHKLNVQKIIKNFFQDLQNEFFSYMTKDSFEKNNSDYCGSSDEGQWEKNKKKKEILDKFMLISLNKTIAQTIISKGFLNIDIIFNDDFNLNDSSDSGSLNTESPCVKTVKKNITSCLFTTLSKGLDFLNFFFKINEGIFHKHFTIMNYSYNFNEKNMIFTFNNEYDTSKKNKIRIFDIFFDQLWISYISYLVLFIYKKSYDFNSTGINYNYLDLEGRKKVCEIFFKKFAMIINIISTEFFRKYKNNFPDFKNFCKKISKFPIKKYNTVDNLCQHFTNYSLEILLGKFTMWNNDIKNIFSVQKIKTENACKISEVTNIETQIKIQENKKNSYHSETSVLNNANIKDFTENLLNGKKKPEKKNSTNFFPDLSSISEPFLNKTDENFRNYIKQEKNIDEFLRRKNINQNYFIENIKKIINKNEKFEYNIFLKFTNKFEKNKNEINIDTEIPINNKINEYIIKESSNSRYTFKTYINSYEIQEIKNENFPQEKYYDFYFIENLGNIFFYKNIQIFFDKIKDYSFIKKYNDCVKSNLNISFDRRERSIFSAIPENVKMRKIFIKNFKNQLMENIKILKRIKKLTMRLNYIFYDYIKIKYEEIENILKQNSLYYKKNNENNFNLEKHLSDQQDKKECFNNSSEKFNLIDHNYYINKIGHVLLVFKKNCNAFEYVDNLIDYLITED